MQTSRQTSDDPDAPNPRSHSPILIPQAEILFPLSNPTAWHLLFISPIALAFLLPLLVPCNQSKGRIGDARIPQAGERKQIVIIYI